MPKHYKKTDPKGQESSAPSDQSARKMKKHVGKNVKGHERYNKAVDKYNAHVKQTYGKGSGGTRSQMGGMGRGTKKKGGGKSYRTM